jgi:heme-degrading monooxygenase HmoA
MSVVFINLFEVPAGRDETFRVRWQQVNDYMRTQPGYQAHRLPADQAGGLQPARPGDRNAASMP